MMVSQWVCEGQCWCRRYIIYSATVLFDLNTSNGRISNYTAKVVSFPARVTN